MSLKKTLAVFAATVGALGVTATSASASAPPNDVVQNFTPASTMPINKLGTDAMGSDTFANRNREFVDIKNTAAVPAVITDYRTEDAWAFGDNSPSPCNTFKVSTTNVDASMVAGPVVTLPAGHTLRVYTGAGVPAVAGTFHFAYMNSPVGCGASGHYITNAADDLYWRDGTAAHTVVSHVRFNRLGGYKVDIP